MRALFAFSVLAVVALLAAMWWLRGDAPPPLPPGADGREPPAATAPSAAIADVIPARTVATHVEREPVAATGLADAPTACLRVLDHATSRPVEGAVVRRVRDGAELAFTDERGLAPVPLRAFEQLAVVRDGYLLRLAPTRPGSTEQEPQTVTLVADAWSPRVVLAFAGPAGERPADVLVRFRAERGGGGRPQASPMPGGDVVLERAWTEHTMLAGQPVCGDVAVELGTFAPDRVHRLAGGGEVRFVLSGRYMLEATTLDGFTARQPLAIEATPAPRHVAVTLQRGLELAGVVTDHASGAPLADARVQVQGGDPLGLVATTGADGAFRLGPLPPGPCTLHVQHVDCEPRAVEGVVAPSADVRVALQPLPASTLRGRVRLRPNGAPLAGATVAWQPDGRTTAAVRTDADGTFVLRATGTAPARLAITAPGCQPYAELVQPGAPFLEFDLWPGTKELRLDAGLSCLFAGVVLGADGLPEPGVVVRWEPSQPPSPPNGVPGRRVLEGAALQLPQITTTGDDGSFALETMALGPGRLVAADDATAPGPSVAAEARPGATIHGLRLQR